MGDAPLRFGSRPADNNDTTSDSNETTSDQASNVVGGANTAEANNARVSESEKQNLVPIDGKNDRSPHYTDSNPSRSLNELGITSTVPDDLKLAQAAQAAAQGQGTQEVEQSAEVLFSCHPMQNFAVGPYRFENSVLKLTGEDAAKFEKTLEGMPAYERNRIYKIDRSKVDEIVKSRQAATQLNDSSVERRALENLGQNGGKQFGDEEVGFNARELDNK